MLYFNLELAGNQLYGGEDYSAVVIWITRYLMSMFLVTHLSHYAIYELVNWYCSACSTGHWVAECVIMRQDVNGSLLKYWDYKLCFITSKTLQLPSGRRPEIIVYMIIAMIIASYNFIHLWLLFNILYTVISSIEGL